MYFTVFSVVFCAAVSLVLCCTVSQFVFSFVLCYMFYGIVYITLCTVCYLWMHCDVLYWDFFSHYFASCIAGIVFYTLYFGLCFVFCILHIVLHCRSFCNLYSNTVSYRICCIGFFTLFYAFICYMAYTVLSLVWYCNFILFNVLHCRALPITALALCNISSQQGHTQSTSWEPPLLSRGNQLALLLFQIYAIARCWCPSPSAPVASNKNWHFTMP